ncbi:MAG: ABC transporter permease [Burkholderiales bacterium]|nr:ABC transporter permease [Burkholderiales bacterium]
MTTDKTPTLLVIEPVDGRVELGLADIWEHRRLFYWLTWRDIKVRYKHALMGILWALLQPLALVAVLTFAIGLIARFPAGAAPLPVFLLAGIAIWSMFSAIVNQMSHSLQANSALVSKVYFPRLTVVLSSAGIPLMDFLVMYGLLFVACFVFGAKVSPLFPLSILFALLGAVLAIGVGLWLATLNTKYPDSRFLVPVILQAGMFASPVIYSLELVPEAWRPVVAVNPMVGIIEGFRFFVFGEGSFDWRMATVSVAAAGLALVTGIRRFQRDERELIDAL